MKLWTALVTPFSDTLKVDYPSLEKMLRHQEEAGVGVLLLGSTGEGLALNLDEKKKVLEFALNLKLRVPIMAGVGGHQLPETLEWVSYLNQLDLHSYLLVTPLYAKPGAKGQFHWFKSLLDQSKKPCMLYNIPSRAGTSLNLETCVELASHPNFWAIKEASGSVMDFQNYQKALPDIKIYSGDDALTPQFKGCNGLVSVMSNPWPKQTLNFLERCQKNENLSPDYAKAANTLFLASNPVPTKVLLAEIGLIQNPAVRAPLSLYDLREKSPLLASHQTMKELKNEL